MAYEGHYISIFHNRHGVDAAIVSGDDTAYWQDVAGHDPEDEDEYCDIVDLPPLFASAPHLLHACKLALEVGMQDYVKFILAGAIARAEGRVTSGTNK